MTNWFGRRAETQARLTVRNAITLELLVVAFADTWIPLSPAGADLLARARDLDAAHPTAPRCAR